MIDLQLMHSDFFVIFCDEYAFFSLLVEFLNFRCVCRILFLNHLTPLSNDAQVGICFYYKHINKSEASLLALAKSIY